MRRLSLISFVPFISLARLTSSLFIVLYLITSLPRVFYPYDLDFIEDSMLMQSIRIADGQPVFVAPNAEFMPHVYMPLYSFIGGMLIKVMGASFVPMRLLSFGATLITAILIFVIAQRETQEKWIGFACAALFLGGYRITGFWYELARVDSLFVMLLMIGMMIGLRAQSAPRLLAAAAVMTLAFFTKQTAVLFAGALALYLFFNIRWRVSWFVIPFAALVSITILILNAMTDGWFWYHTFTIAGGDPIELGRVINYVFVDVLWGIGGLSLMLIIALSEVHVGGLRFVLPRFQSPAHWLVAIFAAFIVSGVGRSSVGGNVNNLMPVYAFLCLSPMVFFVGAKHASPLRTAFIASAVILQFILGAYNPLRYIPTPTMRESGDRLVKRIAATNGEVLVMMHPYYAMLAGKQPSAQIAVLWYGRGRGTTPLPDDFVKRIQNHYYSMIISDESLFEIEDTELQSLLSANYVKTMIIDESESPPAPVGMLVQPKVIYVPKK